MITAMTITDQEAFRRALMDDELVKADAAARLYAFTLGANQQDVVFSTTDETGRPYAILGSSGFVDAATSFGLGVEPSNAMINGIPLGRVNGDHVQIDGLALWIRENQVASVAQMGRS